MSQEIEVKIFGTGYDFGIGSEIDNDKFQELLMDAHDTTPFDWADHQIQGASESSVREILVTISDENGTKTQMTLEKDSVLMFDSNREIRNSDYFTEEQAEFVISKIKREISGYYKLWEKTYRSIPHDSVELRLDLHKGAFIADLIIEGDFDPSRLFFILGATLPDKERFVIYPCYKSPDGSIQYESFTFEGRDYGIEINRNHGESLFDYDPDEDYSEYFDDDDEEDEEDE